MFKDNSPNERYQIVKDNKRCVSCLGTHPIKDCRYKASCGTCHKKHHSLLHFNTSPQNVTQSPASMITPSTPTTFTCTPQGKPINKNCTVLLGTALVNLIAANGRSYVFRALLDSGSMTDFISERAAQLLGTRRHPSNLTVMGLSQTASFIKGSLNLDVESLSGHSIARKHLFHILDKISIDLPRTELSPEVLERVKPSPLADPTFNKPSPIDILLGSALFPHVLTNKLMSLSWSKYAGCSWNYIWLCNHGSCSMLNLSFKGL